MQLFLKTFFKLSLWIGFRVPGSARRKPVRSRDNRRLQDKFYVQNFGCRASQADGATLQASLAARGMHPVDARSAADLVVLNTCTVTASADYDVRQTIRRVHRENPAARILVTGCYAQRAPQELAELPGVEWVVGNSHKADIVNIVNSTAPYHGRVWVGDIFAQTDIPTFPIVEAGADRARPNLKIQDGCHNRCSFCVIPFVRGGNRFTPADLVVEQLRSIAARYREVVLTGINLGRWGRVAGSEMRLAGLLRRLLAETDIDRIRISSVEPMDFSDDLLGLMAESPRIARHVHAPLQSGSDAILRKMHRKYRPRHYADRVQKARTLMPDAAIGADVMTGFPGETDALFEESRQFIESMPFTYLHVFTYSERPGTKAVTMDGAVPVEVRRERNRILREVGERKNRSFRDGFIGRRLSAVTLEQPRTALTTNFLHAELDRDVPANRLVEVVQTSASGLFHVV
jgi:threonylcarbamoyladenosine tRNA methylthiotransferase MtaB